MEDASWRSLYEHVVSTHVKIRGSSFDKLSGKEDPGEGFRLLPAFNIACGWCLCSVALETGLVKDGKAPHSPSSHTDVQKDNIDSSVEYNLSASAGQAASWKEFCLGGSGGSCRCVTPAGVCTGIH